MFDTDEHVKAIVLGLQLVYQKLARVDHLEAENARLRVALQKILGFQVDTQREQMMRTYALDALHPANSPAPTEPTGG